MPHSYTPEFKKKIVHLHEEEGRTYKSITEEYGVSKASISMWCNEFSKECHLFTHFHFRFNYFFPVICKLVISPMICKNAFNRIFICAMRT